MATEFSKGDEPEASDPTHDSDPANADPGHVPLLPPGEVHPLPGQLETAPDGSIRPATPQQLPPDLSAAQPPGLGDPAPPPTAPLLAPPAPELIDEFELAPPSAESAQAAAAPSWAVADASGDGSTGIGVDRSSAVERAAWPTVEPLDGGTAPPASVEEPGEPSPPDTPELTFESPGEPPPAPEQPAPTFTEEPLDDGSELSDTPAPSAETENPSVAETENLSVEMPRAPVIVHADLPVAPVEPAAPIEPVASVEPVPAPVAESPERAEAQHPTTIRTPEKTNSDEEMYDVPLGTLVYRSGLLSADQIESALAESERIGKRLGEVLIDNEMLDERDLGRLLAGQKGLPFLDLAQMEIEQQAAELLPAASARIYCALPIAFDQGTPVVAVSDPTNGLVVEGVRRAMGGELSFAVATRSDLQRAIASSYGDASLSDAEDASATVSDEQGNDQVEPPSEPGLDPTPEEAMTPSQPDLAPEAPHVVTGAADLAAPVEKEGMAPGPLAPAVGAPEAGAAAATTVRVMIRLSNGDTVDAGNYDNEGAAIDRARSLISALEAQGATEWPFLNGRFLRPETITSIDLVEERPRY